MPTNRQERVLYRYGRCLNDNCSKCKTKEIQKIAARKDFVCEECQKPLNECRPPQSFWDKNGKKVIGGLCVLALVIAGVLIIPNLKSGDKDVEETAVAAPVVNEPETEPVVDETPVEEPVEEQVTEEEETTPEPQAQVVNQEPKRSAIQVPFGTYTGPANGLDGEIAVTRNYSLDLRNAAHETIELQPGDVITKTKFKNGELVGGYWKRGSQGQAFHR